MSHSDPTFIHPKLDTLYISLYARMISTEFEIACNDDGSSAYPVSAFDRVAIEYGLKGLLTDLAEWKQKPKTWQLRHGVRELCVPRLWPATDYAAFFRRFGAQRVIAGN